MREAMRVLIVDDEPLARTKLKRLLTTLGGVEVVGEAAEIVAAEELVRSARPDAILLDVNLPGGSGFELLDRIPPDDRPAVIFITAYDEHAVRAFSVRAVDYVLKPFDGERLGAALERACEAVRSRRQPTEDGADAGDGAAPLSRFVVRGVGRMRFVEADSVDWIEAAGNYVRLHHAGESHLLRETMSALEARLDPRQFIRIHRSTIVNLSRVRELHHILHGDYSVLLHDGTRLTLSRSYRDRFERRVAEGNGERQHA